MAGYQTIEALRPILRSGPPAAPVVDRALVGRDDPVALRVGEHRHWKSKSRFIKAGEHYVLSPDVVRAIRDLRATGESYALIAQKMRVSKGTVVRYSRDVATPLGRKLNCWESPLRKQKQRNTAFAERLRRAGFSYREIAENIDCSEMTVRRLLKHLPKDSSVHTPTRRMVPRVSNISGISCQELRRGQFDTGTKTNAARSKARHILFWLVREYHGESFPVIGKSLGGFDHSSVLHGYRKAARVAASLGVTTKLRPLTAARKLWKADWREAGK